MNMHQKFALKTTAMLLSAIAFTVVMLLATPFPVWVVLATAVIVVLFTVPSFCDEYIRKRRRTQTASATIVAKDTSDAKYNLTFCTPDDAQFCVAVKLKVFNKHEVGDSGQLAFYKDWRNGQALYEHFSKKKAR